MKKTHKNPPLRAVFFDLDGTLLDTAPDLINALNRVLAHYNKPAIAEGKLRHKVSDGANALLQMGFDTPLDDPHFQVLRQHFLSFYLEDLATHTTLFDGIVPLLKKIDQHKLMWGIVTNKPWTYTEPLLPLFHFCSAPVSVLCPDHVQEKKPAPEALLLACKQARCSTAEAIYIGDHERDIECGLNANMDTIAVGYGYTETHEAYQHWNAKHTASTANHLWPIIATYLATASSTDNEETPNSV